MSEPWDRFERKLDKIGETLSEVCVDVAVLKNSVPPLSVDVAGLQADVEDLKESNNQVKGAIKLARNVGSAGILTGLAAWLQSIFRGH
jgi:FtsZ-binding cell division protein ZapB